MNLIAGFTAFFLGAVHALEPGHNKAAIAAFAVGHRSSLRHVLVLGLSTAVAHTATILMLALILGATVSATADSRAHQYIEIGSAVLIIITGAWLLRRAARSASRKTAHSRRDEPPHTAECGCHPPHGARRRVEKQFSFGVISLIGISSGLIPCPTALTVLLSAMTAGHLAGGLWTVCLFSTGIALTLCSVALAANFVAGSEHLKTRFARLSKFSGAAKYAPLFAALIIVASGVATLFRALFLSGHL